MSVFKKSIFTITVTGTILSTGIGSAFAGDSPEKKYRIAPQNTQQAAIKNVELQYKNKKSPGSFDMIQNKGWLDVEASKVRLRHLKAGDKYYRQGEYEKAAQAYARILENDDTDAFANYRVGMAELGLKRHEVARLYLQNAVKYNPELYPAYTGLGASYVMDGQEEKAGEILASLNEWAEKCGVLCSANSEMQKSRSDINGMIAWGNAQ